MSANKVMVVDDEPLLRDILAEDLQFEGFSVIEASNGHEAYSQLIANPDVKVILSDIRMPNGSGIELLEKIQGEYKGEKPKVVLISGFADVSEAEAIEKGASAFFRKPFNNDAIVDYVKNLL